MAFAFVLQIINGLCSLPMAPFFAAVILPILPGPLWLWLIIVLGITAASKSAFDTKKKKTSWGTAIGYGILAYYISAAIFTFFTFSAVCYLGETANSVISNPAELLQSATQVAGPTVAPIAQQLASTPEVANQLVSTLLKSSPQLVSGILQSNPQLASLLK